MTLSELLNTKLRVFQRTHPEWLVEIKFRPLTLGDLCNSSTEIPILEPIKQVAELIEGHLIMQGIGKIKVKTHLNQIQMNEIVYSRWLLT